jgi:hypothetical protein
VLTETAPGDHDRTGILTYDSVTRMIGVRDRDGITVTTGPYY